MATAAPARLKLVQRKPSNRVESAIATIGTIVGYNDVRRTDNFIGVPGKNGGQVPQRFLYARSELNANASAPNPVPPVGEETPVNSSINYTGV